MNKKTVVSIAVILIAAIAVIFIGGYNKSPSVERTMLIIGSVVAVALLAWVFKSVARFIGGLTTSLVFVTLSLAVLGFMAAKSYVNPIVAFSVATPLGATLFCLVIRKLGKLAEKSIIMSEVFSFLTDYKIKSYLGETTMVEKEVKIADDTDYKNITLILVSNWGFKNAEAKEAARVAIEQTPQGKLEDKVKTALQYLGNKDKKEVIVQE